MVFTRAYRQAQNRRIEEHQSCKSKDWCFRGNNVKAVSRLVILLLLRTDKIYFALLNFLN